MIGPVPISMALRIPELRDAAIKVIAQAYRKTQCQRLAAADLGMSLRTLSRILQREPELRGLAAEIHADSLASRDSE